MQIKFLVQGTDRQKSVHAIYHVAQKQLLNDVFKAARTVKMQTRFTTHEYLDAASLCHESCPEMSPTSPSVNPQRVKLATTQTARKPIVERSPEGGDVRITQRRKKFIPVTVEQGHVP